MATKSISSTEAQNHFGKLLDDAANNRTRYVVERRGVPQAAVLGFDDLLNLLSDDEARREMRRILAERRPQYGFGRILE